MIETFSDLERFPDYFKNLAYSIGTATYARPWFVSKISSKNGTELVTEIKFERYYKKNNLSKGFMNLVSEVVISLFLCNSLQNEIKNFKAMYGAIERKFK